MGLLNAEETQQQSRLAFTQWRKLWLSNVEKNKNKIKTSHKDVLGCFRNKEAYLFSFGPSFPRNVEEVKKLNRKNIVIGCVDKAFRPMVEMGIIPDFVCVADGEVSADKWLKGVPDEAIKQTILISNIYGSSGWADKWHEVAGDDRIYWYLNKDNIDPNEASKKDLFQPMDPRQWLNNQKENFYFKLDRIPDDQNVNHYGTAEYFAPHANYGEMIEAASNVGNSLVVFTVKIFGCKSVNLFGYDYCWYGHDYYGGVRPEKASYIPKKRAVDRNNNLVYLTTNMEFSAKWLDTYIMYVKQNWDVNVWNCTGAGMLIAPGRKVA